MSFDIVQDIPPEETHRRIAEGAMVVDVRTAEEVAQGTLPGALHIPYDQLPARIAELGADKGAEILFFCQSGRRSQRAAAVAKEAGFSRAINAGGYPLLSE